MAAVWTSTGVTLPPAVCTAQSLCTTLGIALLCQSVYAKHLTQSPTEKDILNFTPCERSPSVPYQPLGFAFFLPAPQVSVPSASLITMMRCSHRALVKTRFITDGQRASGPPAWEAGSATPDLGRGTAWPQTSRWLWAQTGGKAQP